MSEGLDKLSRLKDFLIKGIWEVEPSELSRGKLVLLRQVQIVSLAIRDFYADHCLLRASALTYTTLLSIVPLLALMFSLLKGFGVQNALEPLILERIAIGSEKIVTEIIRYINNTNVGRLGALGLLFLIIAVLTLISNIEETFNHIWGVRETRSLFRRFADYFSVVLIGPLFIFVAISMTTTLESQTFLQKLMSLAYVGQVLFLLFQILPFIAMWAAFTFLYIFMPNTRVQFSSAVIGGILGGTLWQLAQWGYVNFQIGVARYNAIYGTMAALPIFMVWIYLSWLIVLLGLEVTYSHQNLRTVRREIRGGDVNFSSRELVALTILLVVGEAFYRGEKPWSQEKIAEELELPPRLAQNVLSTLVRLGFLSVVQDGSPEGFAYQPAQALQNLEVYAVVGALKDEGESYTKLRHTPEREVIREVEQSIEAAGRQALDRMTLEDLVLRMAKKKEGKKSEGPRGEGP